MRVAILALLAAWMLEAGAYLSPIAVVASRDGKLLYVAEAGAGQVAVVDLATGSVSARIPLEGSPTGLALSPDGARLFVTDASPRGKVYIVATAGATPVGSIVVGHTPYAVAASPDGQTLYACNRFDNNVAVVSLTAGRVVTTIPVGREPVAAVLSPDGATLFLANLLPGGAANAPRVAAGISVIDTATRTVSTTLQLPNGSTSLHGLCLSPDGTYLYATHILARFQLPTTQVERGWMNTNALSVIDARKRRLVSTVLLDDVDLGAANPRGVACSADGRWLVVAHAGTNELSLIDRRALHEKLAKTEGDASTDLAFLARLRRRVQLAGTGPRGVVVAGATVYAAEYYSDSIAAAGFDGKVTSLPLGPRVVLSEARRGEILFHDATLGFQQWQSCSSCHPGGARVDGLNWDLLNDGVGSPRNVKSLLLAHRTPPAMITGIRKSAEVAVRAGISRALFAELPERDAAALDAYLRSLKPVASPRLIGGKLSASAQRGQRAFAQAGCSHCHPAPLFTDQRKHDVGTASGGTPGEAFDTPTLIECWRTAPYLNDGRAVTIREVLTKFNGSNRHGHTRALSPRQISDLVEYVESL